MNRRAFVTGVSAAGMTSLAFPSALRAQAPWPNRPVKLIVPFAAGGATDLVARPWAEALGKAFNQQFVIENRGGAQGLIGAEAVSPQVGADLRNRAIYVTFAACIGMLIYVAFRFKSWGFGIGAIVAVLHDVLVTLGIFSLFQLEINLTVIAALLTLVGYSMNDTIVIFDRIREMLKMRRRESLETLSNDAINQTLSRTIITSGLTFLTVVALVAFGGEVLKSFSWCLFIGIIIGTYSSIYIASPFMLWWEGPVKEWWKQRKGDTAVSSTPGSIAQKPLASSTAPQVATGNAGAVARPAKKKKKGRPASAGH